MDWGLFLVPMPPTISPESILCLGMAEVLSGEWGDGYRTQAQGRRLRPPLLQIRQSFCLKLRELRHLLHVDGVEEPGIEALGKKGEKA